MCCFETRKWPAFLVSALSLLIVVVGLVLGAVTYQYNTREGILRQDLGDLTFYVDSFRNLSSLLCLMFALGTVGLGIIGSTCCCKCYDTACSCCWAVFYAIVLFIWGVLMLIVGIAVFGVATSGPMALDEICENRLSIE